MTFFKRAEIIQVDELELKPHLTLENWKSPTRSWKVTFGNNNRKSFFFRILDEN